MIGNAEVSKTSQSGSKPDRGAKSLHGKITYIVFYETSAVINTVYLNRPRIDWEMELLLDLIEEELRVKLGEK